MAVVTSPLRYPGGKSSLVDLISRLLRHNGLERGHYVEPFAGGCGLALNLLYDGYVSDIHINDIDPAIWSFWYSVLHHTDDLIKLIKSTKITVEEWRIQKKTVLEADKSDPIKLGFAVFFLNRTNRSGIISGAGIIGGYDQTGKYKMDCRFNRDDLCERIRRVKRYDDRINLYNMDARQFIKKSRSDLPKTAFFCIDPPYYNKGSELYTNFYTTDDHRLLSKDVEKIKQPWIVTYDNAHEIQSIYKGNKMYSFNINYSAQIKRIGTELLICAKNIIIPDELIGSGSLSPLDFHRALAS